MSVWQKEVYKGYHEQRIKTEYRKLLAIRKTDMDAEQLIVEQLINQAEGEDTKKGNLWVAFATCQWEFGRLSANVKEKASFWLASKQLDFSPQAQNELQTLLNSPLPKRKTVRLPAYVSHCPWPVGSLLAYRIISSTHPHVTQSPFFKKYVLLRIIAIKRHPISALAPDDAWHETMLVGLYNWIGDSIPVADITKQLAFTEITIRDSLVPPNTIDLLRNIDLTKHTELSSLVQDHTKKRVETCCSLDWKCVKGIDPDEIFTYLGHDPAFQNAVPSFFKTGITEYAISHSVPFDATLVNRFLQLTKGHGDDSNVISSRTR